jgi:HEAT repeat protein
MTREKGKRPLRREVLGLDEELGHQLEVLWKKAEQGIHGLQMSREGHQQGTLHCRAVEDHLSALIPDSWKGMRFAVLDLFLLSAAAALHDIGKANDSPDDHGHRSARRVREEPKLFGLEKAQATAVAWIIQAHNDGNLEALPSGSIHVGVNDVDVRRLAALFKVADALDTYYRRVPNQSVGSIGKQTENDPKTRFRSMVMGWGFDDQGRIELDMMPKNWDDVRVIHAGYDMIRQEIQSVAPTLQKADLACELALRVSVVELLGQTISGEEAEQRVKEGKRQREWMSLMAKEYASSRTPLQVAQMARLYAVREQIVPDDDQIPLLLHSCLLGRGPAWFWLRCFPGRRILGPLLDALAHRIPDIWWRAASTVAALVGPEAVPDLQEMLSDENDNVRQVSASALAEIYKGMGKEGAAKLQEMLNHEDTAVRREAGVVLVWLLGHEDIPILRQLLEDEDRSIRREAFQALQMLLWEMKRRAMPYVYEMIKSTNEMEQRVAKLTLSRVAKREDVSDLRTLLSGSDGEVRKLAVYALARVAGRDAIPDLKELLKDQDTQVGEALVSELARVMGPEDISDLQEMLRNKDRNVKCRAAEVLAKIYYRMGPEGIHGLREMLNHREARVRWRAVCALEQPVDQVLFSELQRLLLEDSDVRVREEAARVLAQIMQGIGQEGIPCLESMSAIRNENIRKEAERALVQVRRQEGRDGIPYLKEMLKDAYSYLRPGAAEALKELMTEEDLAWLTEWVICYPESGLQEVVNELLVHLDHRLYFEPLFCQ